MPDLERPRQTCLTFVSPASSQGVQSPFGATCDARWTLRSIATA
jgi:hypothetical protein